MVWIVRLLALRLQTAMHKVSTRSATTSSRSIVTGVIDGFSFDASPLEVLAGIGLLLVFGYAFSWMFAWLGLLVSSPEAANFVGFIAVFPLTFLSSAFVPDRHLPADPRSLRRVNPFTVTVDAMRSLWLDAPAGTRCGGRSPGRSG